MYYNTLILLDGSDISETVLQYVQGFVSSAGGERLTLVRVDDSSNPGDALYYLQHQANSLLEGWPQEMAPVPDIDIELISGSEGGVPDAIKQYASGADVDVVMMATRGWSGADWWTTGTTAQHIIRESVVPVFAARLWLGRHRRPGEIRRILVPLDGSLLAEQALPYAEHIARTASAELSLLHVIPEDSRITAMAAASSRVQPVEMDAAKYLEAIGQGFHQSTKFSQNILSGLPGQRISQMAQGGSYDIIVMSSHGYSGSGRGELGGIAERVLHGCHIPVLIVPQGAKVPEV